jgi:transposase
MNYFGLTPSEYSSGEKRQQGGITKAGNGACRKALVEAAHHYRMAPRVSREMQVRQEGQTKEVRAIAFKAQERLHGRFRLMTGHHKKVVVVVAALARELCGFVWAIACQVSAPQKLKRCEKTTVKATRETTPKTVASNRTSQSAVAGKREYRLDPDKMFKK